MKNRWYVHAGASGDHNGTSWENAFTNIHSAISRASYDQPSEIWVAAGTYTRDENNREYVIELEENINLYGGFKGVETTRKERNIVENRTFIDGQKKRRCVLGAENSIIDGFIIQNGYSTGKNVLFGSGAGMLNDDCSPTIRNCIFQYNFSEFNGGAIWNSRSSPIISNCLFIKNHGDYGAAIRNYRSSPLIKDCLLSENTTRRPLGGSIDNFHSSITVSNSIIWEESLSIGNYESSSGISYSCIRGGYEGDGNIDSDPLLVAVRYCPSPNSPCIDAGNIDTTSLEESDLLGKKRIQNDRVDMGPYEYEPGTETISLKITLGPAEIYPLTPQWSLDDGEWFEYRTSLVLYPGQYNIDFTPLGNWKNPGITSVTVSPTNTSQAIHYTPLPGNHLIYVDITTPAIN